MLGHIYFSNWRLIFSSAGSAAAANGFNPCKAALKELDIFSLNERMPPPKEPPILEPIPPAPPRDVNARAAAPMIPIVIRLLRLTMIFHEM